MDLSRTIHAPQAQGKGTADALPPFAECCRARFWKTGFIPFPSLVFITFRIHNIGRFRSSNKPFILMWMLKITRIILLIGGNY
jgi:hypothetical protein